MTHTLRGARRPFTARLNDLRRSMRYQDLACGCNEARSAAWFNNLVNYGPSAVSAPGQDTWPGLALLLRTDVAGVRELIAEEWYGVRKSDTPEHLESILKDLLRLHDDDLTIVARLASRLASASTPPEYDTSSAFDIGDPDPEPYSETTAFSSDENTAGLETDGGTTGAVAS